MKVLPSGKIGRIAALMISIASLSAMPGIAQDDYRDIVRQATPGVVTIAVFDSTGHPIGQGSGFFVDTEHIITSRHVVEGAARAEFRTSSGKIFVIDGVSGDDPFADLASLHVRVPPDIAHPLPLARTPVEIGEAILAIGTPLGFDLTVSNGIVSSRRDIPSAGAMLQITAPVSPGSSGGPVLNRRGEVVGVTCAVIDKGQNLNFATPAERLRALNVGAPVPLSEWGRRAFEHQLLPPDAPEFMRDSASAKFVSDYAFERATALMDHREYEQAVQFFMTAASLQPLRADAYYKAGMCEIIMGHAEQAAAIFEQGVRAAPMHTSMRYQLGRMQIELHKLKEAVATLQEALRLDSTYAPAWYELGQAHAMLRNDTVACLCLVRAVRLKPDYADARMTLGILYADHRQYPEAVKEFAEAVRLDSTNLEAKGSLGAVYNQMGRYSEALPLLKAALRAMPDNAGLRGSIGYALFGLNRCTEAERELRESLHIQPDNALTHFYMGSVCLCLNRNADAVAELTEAIRIEPGNPMPHYALGMTYATAQKDRAAALGEYRILQNLDPEAALTLFKAIYPK